MYVIQMFNTYIDRFIYFNELMCAAVVALRYQLPYILILPIEVPIKWVYLLSSIWDYAMIDDEEIAVPFCRFTIKMLWVGQIRESAQRSDLMWQRKTRQQNWTLYNATTCRSNNAYDVVPTWPSTAAFLYIVRVRII